MSKDYPTEVCGDCGRLANNMTCLKKYGQLAYEEAYGCSTLHTAVCDICGQRKYVTEPRDYFYPDERAFRYLKRYLAKGKL
jgi:hypothetical protein